MVQKRTNLMLYNMMKHPTICLVFLLLVVSVSTNKSDIICRQYDLGTELEFQCTSENDDENYLILRQFKTLKKVIIECSLNHIDYVDMLPPMTENINQVQIKYCPLPKEGFLSVLQVLNVTEIRLLSIKSIMPVVNKAIKISSTLFKGLSFLEYLKLTDNDKITLEDNFVQEIPGLKELDLYNNNFVNLEKLNFLATPNLEWLQMGKNNMKEIPNGLFKNLKQLKQLYLFNNNLKSLNADVFAGTDNLQMIELSINHIATLNKHTFSNMTKLEYISFFNNHLSLVQRDIFENNKHMFQVKFGSNPRLQIDDYVLAKFLNLKIVKLDKCQLKSLPVHLFAGSLNLSEIYLQNNHLEDLQNGLFNDLSKLTIIDLSCNKLKTVTEKTFESLISLKHLNLEDNHLTSIDTYVFKNLNQLENLNLQYNKIRSVSEMAFYNLTALVELNLAHNQLEFYDAGIVISPFSQCVKLQILDLSFNNLQEWKIWYMSTSVYLEKVNVSHNKIKNINLLDIIENVFSKQVFIDFSSNAIAVVNTYLEPSYFQTKNTITLNIQNNSIDCNCYNYGLISHLHGGIDLLNTIEFSKFSHLKCSKPNKFKHMKLTEIPLEAISCPIDKIRTDGSQCEKNCNCFWKTHKSLFVMDCSNKNLSKIPEFKAPTTVRLDSSQTEWNINGVEIYAEYNNLQAGPNESNGYENVTKLILSHNNINSLRWIPPSLSVLHLDNNQLTSLDERTIEQLNASFIVNITLDENPWNCDCSILSLRDYLFQKKDQVDSRNIRCKQSGQSVIQLTNLCKWKNIGILSVLIIVVLLLFFIASSIALYFRFQNKIRLWLYSKKLCLWFFTEDKLDKDKMYDVFISFAHNEDLFVLKTLLPALESEPNSFKVCMHYRDFIPGEAISNQVAKSVTDSRRTLVILSNSYIESCWTKMEFRLAHTQAIREGRARTIVIIYEDIDELKLDDELKAYLRTNTYIKWGDPWFWQKLRYALPRRKFHKKVSQKYSNNMLNDIILNLNSQVLSNYPNYISEKVENINSSDSSEHLVVNGIS